MIHTDDIIEPDAADAPAALAQLREILRVALLINHGRPADTLVSIAGNLRDLHVLADRVGVKFDNEGKPISEGMPRRS